MALAELASREAVKAESCELAAAMRPNMSIDPEGVRFRGTSGATSSKLGMGAVATSFNSSV